MGGVIGVGRVVGVRGVVGVTGVEVVGVGVAVRGGEGGGNRAGFSLSIETDVSPCGSPNTKYFGSRRITLNGP
jgi:hypothetical protein